MSKRRGLGLVGEQERVVNGVVSGWKDLGRVSTRECSCRRLVITNTE